MHRVDTSTAAESLPAPQAQGTPGFFTKGNPSTPTPATQPGPDWFNMIQEELYYLVTQAGLTPDATKADFTQVYQAVVALRAAQTLGALADVTISSPQDGQALIYSGGSWVNGAPTIENYKKEVALNALRDAMGEGAGAQLINAWTDPYAGVTGINTGASSGYALNAARSAIHNNPDVAIAAATGSVFGNMIGNAGLSAAFDDETAQSDSVCASTNGEGQGDGYIGKDWGSGTPRTVKSVVVYPSNTSGFANDGASASVEVRLYGSNTSPANMTDGTLLATTGSFTDGTAAKTLTVSSPTSYRYNWVAIVIGTSSYSTYVAEVVFYEGGTVQTLDLYSVTRAPLIVPSTGYLLTLVEPVDAVTYGTDFLASLTRDGGSTWDTVSLAKYGTTTIDVGGSPTELDVVYGETDLTGSASQDFEYRLQSANDKELYVHGTVMEAA